MLVNGDDVKVSLTVPVDVVETVSLLDGSPEGEGLKEMDSIALEDGAIDCEELGE